MEQSCLAARNVPNQAYLLCVVRKIRGPHDSQERRALLEVTVCSPPCVLHDICDSEVTKSDIAHARQEGATMKRSIAISIVFSIVFIAFSAAICAGEVKHYQIQSKILSDAGESAQRTLSVYLPEDYSTSGAPYPVLYLIHGDSGNNLTFLGGGYGGFMSDANVSVIVDRLIQEGKIKPLIVACPDLSGIASYEEYLLQDIVSFVDATFRTIPNRESRAIAGHSRGGYDSLYMTLAYPEVFSIAGGFSSYSMVLLRENLGDLVKAQNKKPYPIRFWLYAGKNDEYGVTQPNRDFVKALRANGFPTEYTEDDGDHISRVAQRLDEFLVYFSKFLRW
jgi:enterochelin esterase-like enzyme